jgi:hypothetical protein
MIKDIIMRLKRFSNVAHGHSAAGYLSAEPWRWPSLLSLTALTLWGYFDHVYKSEQAGKPNETNYPPIYLHPSFSWPNGLAAVGSVLSVSPNPVVAGQPISVSLSLPSGCVENNWSIYFNGSRIGGGSGSSSISASYTPVNPGNFNITATGTSTPPCRNANANTVQEVVSSGTVSGYINPKYLVVGVVYAPPGASSTVAYSTSNTFSSTSNISQLFGSNTQVSVSISGQTGVKGVFQATVTGTTTTSASQSFTSTSSITKSFGQTVQNTYAGTPAFNSPVNHNYDQILIWLNPVLLLSVYPNQVSKGVLFNGYGYDQADTNVQGLDIVPVPVGCLNGAFPAANCNQYTNEFSRSWANGKQVFASGQVPALTQTDLSAIANLDPFSNSNYVFSPNQTYPITTQDGRFTLSGNVNGSYDYFTYSQAQPGQQPNRTMLTNVYTDMSTLGKSTTKTYQEAFGVDQKYEGGSFLGNLVVNIGTTQTFTWTDTVGSSVTNTNTQTDTATIVDPACNGSSVCVPAYTGPIQWNVFQDNIYGTFEFQP